MSFAFPLPSLVMMESQYLERQGVKIPHELKAAIKKAEKNEEKLMEIYKRLGQLPKPKTPYFSSSDFKRICNALPQKKHRTLKIPAKSEIRDKIFGGWFGRVAGCILGKPLECQLTLPKIKEYFGREFPINGYLRLRTARRIAMKNNPNFHPRITIPCSRENIAYAMPDDDLNYSVLSLLLLEQHGYSFTTSNVGEVWAFNLPASFSYGAETTALVNYLWGLPVKSIPVYLNPFRDEIGAQIRADMFGYVSPGKPEEASSLAFREASFSHAADGIYGSMFVAAMIAAAFSCDKMEDIIDIGLGQIPEHSRLAKLVNRTLNWHASLGNWEKVYERIKTATPEYGPGHTVNNAAYVVNALLASKGNYEKGITTTVMQGHDTDCNGATVGSIIGVCCGIKHIPHKWTNPLNDHMKTPLNGLSDISISELAERTFKLTQRKTSSSKR